MKFYHGTTEEAWKKIQKEGVLWGRPNMYNSSGNKMSRINWFALEMKDAGIFDDRGLTNTKCVMLEIDLPKVKKHTYWEFVTYDPIPIDRILRLK